LLGAYFPSVLWHCCLDHLFPFSFGWTTSSAEAVHQLWPNAQHPIYTCLFLPS